MLTRKKKSACGNRAGLEKVSFQIEQAYKNEIFKQKHDFHNNETFYREVK